MQKQYTSSVLVLKKYLVSKRQFVAVIFRLTSARKLSAALVFMLL